MAAWTPIFRIIRTAISIITTSLRPRKLLLHRREIEKLEKETTQKGMTLVVTRIYWKNGRIKFEIGVAKGKKLYDKRETEMRKTIEKETRQQLKEKLR